MQEYSCYRCEGARCLLVDGQYLMSVSGLISLGSKVPIWGHTHNLSCAAESRTERQ